MDTEKLIERLNAYSAEHQQHGGITAEAADAISTLRAENEKLRAELEAAQAALAELTGLAGGSVQTLFGVPLERMRELAQADRKERCVVLPCKKGDTVWRIVHDATPHITKDRCTNIKVENKEVWVNLIGDRVMGGWNFGKLLFLNEKEAEVALKAREQDGNNK